MNWQTIGAGVIGGGVVCLGGYVSGALRAGGTAEVFETTSFAHELPDTDMWLSEPEMYFQVRYNYGDVDGDARMDCVLVRLPVTEALGELPAVVLVGLGQGDGTFAIVQEIELWDELPGTWDGLWSDGVDLHDVNGDGWLDVVHNEVYYKCNDPECEDRDFGNGIRVLLNAQGAGFRCAGDIDGNQRTDVYDVLEVLEDWGCQGGHPN